MAAIDISQQSMNCHFDDFDSRGKQPLSAFMLFASDIKPRLLVEYPNIKTEELSCKLREEWFKLAEEEKVIYHSRAQELAYIHNTKCSEYKHYGTTKSERDLKRKNEENFKHMVEQYYFLQNSGLRLLDSPFIHKSKRSRYDLPYTYRPTPDAPRTHVPKRIPSTKGYRRSYPTYKERIQMMERGIFPRQIQTNLGVFKRSEENPNVLIRDDSADMDNEKQRHPMSTKGSNNMLDYSSYYPPVISTHVSPTNVPSPRLIGNSCSFGQVQMPAPAPVYEHYNFSQHDTRSPYRVEQRKFIQHPSCSVPPRHYHEHPASFYQQTITVPSTGPSYVGINSTNHVDIRGSGSITVKYEPAYQMQYGSNINNNNYINQDLNTNNYLNIDNVHPLNFNDSHHFITDTNVGHMTTDEEDIAKEDIEFREDLDTINPTITVTEGIEQYLSQDGQPYVMIPVDLTVARKLGWPVHMLPTMPNWLSKLSDNFQQDANNVDDASVCSSSSLDNNQENSRDSIILQADEYSTIANLHAETIDAIENLQREMDNFETKDFHNMIDLQDQIMSDEQMQTTDHNLNSEIDYQKDDDVICQGASQTEYIDTQPEGQREGHDEGNIGDMKPDEQIGEEEGTIENDDLSSYCPSIKSLDDSIMAADSSSVSPDTTDPSQESVFGNDSATPTDADNE